MGQVKMLAGRAFQEKEQWELKPGGRSSGAWKTVPGRKWDEGSQLLLCSPPGLAALNHRLGFEPSGSSVSPFSLPCPGEGVLEGPFRRDSAAYRPRIMNLPTSRFLTLKPWPVAVSQAAGVGADPALKGGALSSSWPSRAPEDPSLPVCSLCFVTWGVLQSFKLLFRVRPACRPQLCYWYRLGPLSLSFLICKLGLIILCTSQDWCEDAMK